RLLGLEPLKAHEQPDDGDRYGLDARGLRPIHAWTGGFEEFWNESLDRLNTYVKELQRKEQPDDAD
ncbi:MAG: hypothetical protein KC472_11000, partial [Dehalococcoidia bacterium]|nr:hypothetical protein [Dehalococcoidia bacterium]